MADWKSGSFKQVEDHSQATDALLNRINATSVPVLLRGTNATLDTLLEELSALEKIARLTGDVLSTQRLAVEIVKILRVHGGATATEKMMETAESLMKKRGQTKQVQSAIVTEAARALRGAVAGVTSDVNAVAEDATTSSSSPPLPLDVVSDESERNLLQKLIAITEGRIHVELEHARFVAQYARIVEEHDQRLREASDLLRGLQVETITNMPRLEKLGLLNKQLELALAMDDIMYIPMIARKVTHRALNRPDSYQRKLSYMAAMRQYYTLKKFPLLIGRCWLETYQTYRSMKSELALEEYPEAVAALTNAVVMILVAAHATVKEVGDEAECTAFAPTSQMADRDDAIRMLRSTMANELEHSTPLLWRLVVGFHGMDLLRHEAHALIGQLQATQPLLSAELVEQLRQRASEHDILVVAKYYSRVKISRLSELVQLSLEKTEAFLMSLVTSQLLYARIDRIDGAIVFQKKLEVADVVGKWSEEQGRCMELLDRATHLIVKERMLHNLPLEQKRGAVTA